MGGRATPSPGRVLGRYELGLRVGAGGMGEVWAARRLGARGFAKLVAVKCLRPELAGRPDVERQFLDEATIGSRVRHPHVVRVLDLGEEDGLLFQVLEWVVGAPLRTLVAPPRVAHESGVRPRPSRAGLHPLVAARIVFQLATGLHVAHELRGDDGRPLGVVHCDVTPENVLCTPAGFAKLADFGAAARAGRTDRERLRGNLAYVAPERLRGGEFDRRADVFGLGLLLYELVAGVHPFRGDDEASTLARLVGPVPALPLRARADVSPDLDRLVSAAIAKQPEARPASAAELARALERAVPGAALRTLDDRVAAEVRRVAGDRVDERARAVREALRALDAQRAG